MEVMTYAMFIKQVEKTLKVIGGSDCFPHYYADLQGGRSSVRYNAQTGSCEVHTPRGVINWASFGKPRVKSLTKAQ